VHAAQFLLLGIQIGLEFLQFALYLLRPFGCLVKFLRQIALDLVELAALEDELAVLRLQVIAFSH
jgi:hypothetical protein